MEAASEEVPRDNWPLALGFWMLSVAANYVPLFVYAVSLMKAGTAREEGLPELARAARYTAQQVIILVPLLVVALALTQERQRHQALPQRSAGGACRKLDAILVNSGRWRILTNR